MLFAALARLGPRVPCLRILPFEESLMNPKPVLAVSLLVAIAASLAPLRADEQKPAQKEPWKPEDIIYAESAGQFRISPDGKWAVWVKSSGNKEKDTRVSNLFLSRLMENSEIPLTRGADNNS